MPFLLRFAKAREFIREMEMDLLENSKFKSFIDAFSKLRENAESMSLDEARKQSTDFFCPPSLVKEPVQQVHDIAISGREGNPIAVRLYNPNPAEDHPLFIFYHRGGWVFSNIEEADPVCRKLANHLGCIVASVDYRLAPENPFPKPFNDCYDAFLALSKKAAEYGADEDKVIVGGESAGGNLAAAVCLYARDADQYGIAAQVLLYPVISSTLNQKAYRESEDKYFMTQESMEFFWNMYLQNEEDKTNPYASPDKAQNLEKLPPALIVLAEHDPLRQEGEAFAMRLKDAGNRVLVETFPGVVHGFLDLPMYDAEETVQRLKRIKHPFNDLINPKIGCGG